MQRYKDGTGTAKEATDALNLSTQALNTTLDLTLGRFVSQQQAQVSYNDAIRNAVGTIYENTDRDRRPERRERSQRDRALLSSISAASQWSQSIAAAGGTAAEQQVPLQLMRNELDVLRQGGAESGQDTSFVDGMILTMDNSLAAVKANVTPMGVTGEQIGAHLKGGAKKGTDGMPAETGTAVTSSMDTARREGAASHNVGYGIGVKFGGGRSATASTPIPATSQRRQGAAVQAAKRAAEGGEQTGSPSRLFRDEIGVPIAQGIAVGIEKGTPSIVLSAHAGDQRHRVGAASWWWYRRRRWRRLRSDRVEHQCRRRVESGGGAQRRRTDRQRRGRRAHSSRLCRDCEARLMALWNPNRRRRSVCNGSRSTAAWSTSTPPTR